MAYANINIRIDAEVKQNAQKLFERLGLDMTTAVNIFLRQAISRDTFPVEILPIAANNSGSIPVLGSMKGKITIAEDFDAPLEAMIISEKALAYDWNSAEEDAAWANL
jgi:addiction module RelB/DinJ family antitoxin